MQYANYFLVTSMHSFSQLLNEKHCYYAGQVRTVEQRYTIGQSVEAHFQFHVIPFTKSLRNLTLLFDLV